jgi:hypothetical protein
MWKRGFLNIFVRSFIFIVEGHLRNVGTWIIFAVFTDYGGISVA